MQVWTDEFVGYRCNLTTMPLIEATQNATCLQRAFHDGSRSSLADRYFVSQPQWNSKLTLVNQHYSHPHHNYVRQRKLGTSTSLSATCSNIFDQRVLMMHPEFEYGVMHENIRFIGLKWMGSKFDRPAVATRTRLGTLTPKLISHELTSGRRPLNALDAVLCQTRVWPCIKVEIVGPMFALG